MQEHPDERPAARRRDAAGETWDGPTPRQTAAVPSSSWQFRSSTMAQLAVPFSPGRRCYAPKVTLPSDKREGPAAGTHVFPALEFLVMLLVHVPDTRERLVREYGAYSARRRARSSQGRYPHRDADSGRDLFHRRRRHTRLISPAAVSTPVGGIVETHRRGGPPPTRAM
jgi:hypothetical protein